MRVHASNNGSSSDCIPPDGNASFTHIMYLATFHRQTKKTTGKKDLRFPAWIIVRSCYINKRSKHDCLVISEKLSVIQQEIDSNLLKNNFFLALKLSQASAAANCAKVLISSSSISLWNSLSLYRILRRFCLWRLGNNATKVCYTYSSHGSRGSSPSYSSIASIIFLRKWTPRTSSLSSNQAGNQWRNAT